MVRRSPSQQMILEGITDDEGSVHGTENSGREIFVRVTGSRRWKLADTNILFRLQDWLRRMSQQGARNLSCFAHQISSQGWGHDSDAGSKRPRCTSSTCLQEKVGRIEDVAVIPTDLRDRVPRRVFCDTAASVHSMLEHTGATLLMGDGALCVTYSHNAISRDPDPNVPSSGCFNASTSFFPG